MSAEKKLGRFLSRRPVLVLGTVAVLTTALTALEFAVPLLIRDHTLLVLGALTATLVVFAAAAPGLIAVHDFNVALLDRTWEWLGPGTDFGRGGHRWTGTVDGRSVTVLVADGRTSVAIAGSPRSWVAFGPPRRRVRITPELPVTDRITVRYTDEAFARSLLACAGVPAALELALGQPARVLEAQWVPGRGVDLSVRLDYPNLDPERLPGWVEALITILDATERAPVSGSAVAAVHEERRLRWGCGLALGGCLLQGLVAPLVVFGLLVLASYLAGWL